MQRSYPLRWLALAIGLLGTQCLDSISDDCTKTLTCDDQQPVLNADCVWRYPDGSEWVAGPRYDEATRRWRWPDGKETDTQTFQCSILDAGGDAGPAGPDCRSAATPCDAPYVCDLGTGACVECLDDSQCAGAAPTGDAGAANVCDRARHECVQCMVNANCASTGDTPVCKVDRSDSTRNECVQCEAERDCGGATPACDVNTNECTTRCTTQAECGGDKPFCKVADQICVECLAAGDCTSATNSQCNVGTSECVECVDDSPCAANGEVCDTTRNLCVQCRTDLQCASNPSGLLHCDPQSNLCVQCLNDLECSGVASSRCNVAEHVCVGCTDDAQCENGLRCNNPTLDGGTCVQCLESGDCTIGLERTCETTSHRCVECLDTSQCLGAETAHCQIAPTIDPLEPQYSCVGCRNNGDCGGKDIPGVCREVDGLCVNCEGNAACFPNVSLSRCDSNGNCAICSDDTDCDLFTSPGLGRRACKPAEGCVECVEARHCTGNPNGPICKTIDGAGTGSAPINTCVECRTNLDCQTPGASVCNASNECVPCAADIDCSHVDSNGATAGGTQLDVCDAGTCVQCSGSKRLACGQFVCDAATKTCTTDRPARMAVACDSCVSDQECAVNARCVRQTFGGRELGFSCLPMAAGTPAVCAGPRTFLGLVTRATIDGEDATTPSVCQPRQTTCAALAELGASCTDDADCGEASLADGVCNTLIAQCSVPCAVNADCARACDLATGSCTLD